MRFALRLTHSLLLMTLLALVLTSCQQQRPIENQHVADPGSALLKGLMQTSDYSGDWHWFDDSVDQNAEVPSAKNSYHIETAFHSLTGNTGKQGDSTVTIYHVLWRYEHSSPSIAGFGLVGFESGDEVIDIQLPQLGLAQKSECIRQAPGDNYGVVCRIIVKYDHIISKLEIEASDRSLDRQAILDIFIPVLRSIDERVKNIEK